MSLSSLLVHDVTIIQPGSDTSRYGDEVKDWDNVTTETVKGWISQQSRSEVLGDQETQVSDWILYLHPTADIVGGDRVEWEGVTFEVAAPPNHAWRPSTGEHHIEVSLHAVTDSPRVAS